MDHKEPDVALVPNVQVSVLRAVGEHSQNSPRRPQVKCHIHCLPLQQVESKGNSGVLGVGDVQDATGDESVAGLGAGVRGVYVGRDGEGLLVQLGYHDALIRSRGKYQPQAVFVCRHLEIGLGVCQQVRQVVEQGVVYAESVKPPGSEVKSGKG